MTSVLHLALVLVLTTWAMAMAAPTAGAQAIGRCLDGVTVQAMIADHQIKSWATVKAEAGYRAYKDLGIAQVCEIDGSLHYVMNAQTPAGQPRRLILDAVTGAN
jgi:hypothetical protein